VFWQLGSFEGGSVREGERAASDQKERAHDEQTLVDESVEIGVGEDGAVRARGAFEHEGDGISGEKDDRDSKTRLGGAAFGVESERLERDAAQVVADCEMDEVVDQEGAAYHEAREHVVGGSREGGKDEHAEVTRVLEPRAQPGRGPPEPVDDDGNLQKYREIGRDVAEFSSFRHLLRRPDSVLMPLVFFIPMMPLVFFIPILIDIKLASEMLV